MPFWIKKLVVALVSLGGLRTVMKMNERKVDLFFMRLFRDLGRFKAQKRRRRVDQESHSLMTILLQKDNPLDDLILDAEDEDESDLPTYTPSELFEFGCGDQETAEGDPILLVSIYGRVYDVTKGSKYYGEDGPYSQFPGHDVTYALATGCRTQECLDQDEYNLSEKDQNEGKRWLSFFHLHDKYPLVGKLEGDHFETLLLKLMADDQELLSKNRSQDPNFKPEAPIQRAA